MNRRKRVPVENRMNRVLLDLGYILAPPIVVLILHILRQLLLPLAVEVDIIAHFVGGLSIGWATTNAYRVFRRRGVVPHLPLPLYAFTLWASVALAGVLWELNEFAIFNTLFTVPRWLNVYIDTIFDLTMDLLGGLIWILIESYRVKK